MNHGDQARGKPDSHFFRADLVLVGFLVIAGFYLVAEHRAHLMGWLPWILLLACPLMHLFMHGGHGGHRRDTELDTHSSDNRRNSQD